MAKIKPGGFLPSYFDELIGPARARYEVKVKMCDDVDPYRLSIGSDATANADLLPSTTYADIFNYLVLTTNFVTHEQMKAYKSLEAHNFFTSGWVKGVAVKELPSKRVIVLSEVNHSQRLRDPPLKSWILACADGSIITAHCTCMAGVGEACSHVGATLFAVDTAVRIRDAKTCTEKDNIWLPAHNPRAEYKRLRDIDFSSAETKRKRLNSALTSCNTEDEPDLPAPSLPIPPAPTKEELQLFYSRVQASGVKPAVFMVLPDYCEMFEPPRNREPQLLSALMCPEAQSEDLPALISRSETFLAQLHVSEEMVRYVESSTRMQANCPKWYAYRSGRITASVMKSVCRTSADAPSVSLIKKICYPEKQKFSTAATAWGLQHEADALCGYATERKKHHVNFSYSKSGVWLSEQHPFIAASPDALVQCACCGKGTVEVKCPLSLATGGLQEACSKTDFCLEYANENLQLKRTHSYYYQIQTQMAVYRSAYCDFVVWSPTFLHIERVPRDDAFFQGVLPQAEKFFTHVILPELFAEHFTRKETVNPGKESDAESFCYCGGPEAGKMVACDGRQCKYKWFHYSCVGIKRAPKQKTWFCSECASS